MLNKMLFFVLFFMLFISDIVLSQELAGTSSCFFTCPVPSITGYLQRADCDLLGIDPPAGAIITYVSGECDVDGNFPDTHIWINNSGVHTSYLNWQTDLFNGMSMDNIDVGMTMEYPGEYGHPTNATGFQCAIHISWKGDVYVPPEPLTDTQKNAVMEQVRFLLLRH